MDPDEPVPPQLPPDVLLAVACPCSVRDFIRDNFGLYAPPADYRALREENLKRTAKALLPR